MKLRDAFIATTQFVTSIIAIAGSAQISFAITKSETVIIVLPNSARLAP